MPEDVKPHCDAVLAAFAAYESGDDEETRAALLAIPLGSPFLEWKVLLRGLMAYSANDDVRAIENWSRLKADRLPAHLAAPLRAKLDPAFRQTLTPERATALQARAELLVDTPTAAALNSLRGELHRGRALAGAFRHAESVVARCRHDDPGLVRRLAHVFYRAILDHGEPGDLPRYRKAFGTPIDDPDFHKLQGLKLEQGHAYSAANLAWSPYERWLSGNPLGWSDVFVRRARAVILHRIAENADGAGSGDDLLDAFYGPVRTHSGSPTPHPRGSRPASPAPPDPAASWEQACELAPAWEQPAKALFDLYEREGKVAKAEAVARRFLEHQPDAIWALDSLADLYAKSGNARQALDYRLKVLRANPLDRGNQEVVALTYLALARTALGQGKYADAEAALNEGGNQTRDLAPIATKVLRSVIARATKRIEEADALQAETELDPNRLVARFHFAVYAILAKWKPAARKPIDAAFAAGLAGPATPALAESLYFAWSQFAEFGIDYRGRATHQKKILAYALASAKGDGPTADFERLAIRLVKGGEWATLQKFATACQRRFPMNPVFPLMLAQATIAKGGANVRPHSVLRLLRIARQNAERSADPRHREFLQRITELEQEYEGHFGFGFGFY